MQIKDFLLLTGLFCFTISISIAQERPLGRINGSFQTDVQYLFPDSIIGANEVPERVLSNSYLQLTYQQGGFSAGLRYEAYLNPLLGFDLRFEGQGIPYRFVGYDSEHLSIRVGNIYDQFGNGLVFRAYQEWTLGIDNSVDGVQVQANPLKGVRIKGIIGKQRKFWELGESLLRGADAEFSINEIAPNLLGDKAILTLGGSMMSKYQEDTDVVLQLPENVSAFAGRGTFIYGGFALDAEYAYKINDPFALNDFVYNTGNAFYFNATYSQKGLGLSISGKRLDNFDFRSERDVSLQELTLSFLPPTSRFHTYRLPTLYPYATQLNGEIGIQGTVFYKIPRKTKLGGKYGTLIQANFSRINGPDRQFQDDGFRYTTSFLGDLDNLYFQDVNIDINRKWNKKFRTILTHIWLQYNKDIIEFGSTTAGFGIVNVHATILELQYKIKRKMSIRTELQHMYTKQDLGSWAMALVEMSISPHWYFTVFDEFNYGNPDPSRRVHYYNFSAAYNYESHRFSLSYSRQRRGLLCVGGICREVPASNGFNLSITSTF